MSIRTLRFFLPFVVLGLAVQHVFAGSPNYRQGVTVGQDGKPSLQLTNDSELPITAFVITEFSSSGTENRTYFDVYAISGRSGLPLAAGASLTTSLSVSPGTDVSKLRGEVSAVIFKDGSSAGDLACVNTILARRVRLHDRLLSLHDLLSPLVGTGISPGAIVQRLRATLAEAVKQLPDDDLRAADTMAFFDATWTFDMELLATSDSTLRPYLKRLEMRALVLEYSRPDLETIRNLLGDSPRHQSDANPPPASGPPTR